MAVWAAGIEANGRTWDLFLKQFIEKRVGRGVGDFDCPD
jgi:hypothetical protein